VSEEDRIRVYVEHKLADGTSPAAITAELVRYNVPESRARALVREIAGLPWEGQLSFTPEPVVAEKPVERADLVEFATTQLSSYDATTVHQQLLSQGCSDKEAHEILAATGIDGGVEVTRELPRPQSAGLESTYVRVPVPAANAKGWLSGKQRKVLLRGLWRCIWFALVLLVLAGVGGFFFAGAINAYVSGLIIVPLNFTGVLWLVGWPGLCALSIIGIVVLVADIARHAADSFPGRIRVGQFYLHSPFVAKAGSEVSGRLHMGGRQYRVWRPELHNMVGQWGLQRKYKVYYSPRARWIWHLEPGEED